MGLDDNGTILIEFRHKNTCVISSSAGVFAIIGMVYALFFCVTTNENKNDNRLGLARRVNMMFREDKSTQMAAQFISLAGGKLDYIHLLKLMYIADKAMVIKWGLPITFDSWAALPFGPILSGTYDLIKSQTKNKGGYWADHIATQSMSVNLILDPGDDLLSRAEDNIIAETFREWGKMDKWAVVEATHKFPEWTDPNGSSYPISYDDMLDANHHPSVLKDIVADNVETQQAISIL